MSQSPQNVWQTARPRHSQSGSRTSQSRSGNASPAQQSDPIQPPRQAVTSAGQPNNVWAQRASVSAGSGSGVGAAGGGSNGRQMELAGTSANQEEQHVSLNNFNLAEVKTFLGREIPAAPYKPAADAAGTRSSGSAWGTKPGTMANNQPFLIQLAKQVATLESGRG